MKRRQDRSCIHLRLLKEGQLFRFQDEACIRERDGPEGVCDSDICLEASKRILTSMKRGVDPCRDFYKFACGDFRDQRPYQPSASFNVLQAQTDERIHSEYLTVCYLPSLRFFLHRIINHSVAQQDYKDMV